MEVTELIQQGQRILRGMSQDGQKYIPEAIEFIKVYAGADSSFYNNITKLDPTLYWSDSTNNVARGILEAFVSFLEQGLHKGMSVKRQAQLDVVSDLLEQGQNLLSTSGIHPAAPIVIIGAVLEEFLRAWVEDLSVDISDSKRGIDLYAKTLRERELITKQDIKDITAWGGLRNHAAHGEWNEINDQSRALLMLEGVNLFMRKYGERS